MKFNGFLRMIWRLAVVLFAATLFFAGMLIMAWNVWKTVRSGKAYEAPIPAVVPAHA